MKDYNQAGWGILGTARIAENSLIPGIRDAENSKLEAVASRNAERADNFAGEYDVPRSYGSYEELLEDDRLEFVYVPLPNHLHGKWSKKAARHGKNVLCEKPLGADAEEVREMFQVTEEEGVALMEGFMYRFHPQVRKVKELLEDGEIGEPRFFRGAHSFSLITQDREDDLRWKKEMAGGSLMDLGTYSINTVRFLFGEEPTRVVARAKKHPDHTAEAETQAILEFPGNKTATIDCSFLLDHRANYEVASESGRIQAFDTYNPGLGKETRIMIKGSNGIQEERIEGLNEYALEVEHLVRAARENETPMVSPRDSIDQAKTLDAIRESAKKESWVEV